MATARHVIYKGHTFLVQSSGKYYQDGNHKGINGERLLHRAVWVEKHGPIPERHVIHHKDGDWRNNDIRNLQAVQISKHCSRHMRKRFKNPEYRRRNALALKKAIAIAPAWHSSKAGFEWHKKNGDITWGNKKPKKHKCIVCGATFTRKCIQKKVKFCTQRCFNKHYWKTKTITKNCVRCGRKFSTNKYSGTECCSYSCSAKRRWETRK